jgi:hypothetical protein
MRFTLVAMLSLTSLGACGRAPNPARPSAGCTRAVPSIGEAQDADSWRVSCRELCGESASAGTPDALCARVAHPNGLCLGTRTFALAAPKGGAITAGALLEVRKDGQTTTALAIRTQTGWRLVRGLGGRVRLASVELVDLPGMAPPAVSLRIVDEDAASTERLYVCGVRADATVACPVAIVSGARGWRLDVQLAGDRFSARPAFGDVPPSLRGVLGEHPIFGAP